MGPMGIVSGVGQRVWGAFQAGGEVVVEVTKDAVRAGTGTEVSATAVALIVLGVGAVGVSGLVVWKAMSQTDRGARADVYWRGLTLTWIGAALAAVGICSQNGSGE